MMGSIYEGTFNYTKYARRVFGLTHTMAADLTNSSWAEKDNTPRGAAQRLLYLIIFGKMPKLGEYEHLTLEDGLQCIK